MDVTPLIPAGRQIIETYGEGRFRVSGRVFSGAILVFPTRTVTWPLSDAATPTLTSLAEVVREGEAGTVELLLLGCGARMALVPGDLRHGLRGAGIVVEPMDTGAACRTYNMLMADGRRVAAALIPVS